jgi:hypothetical protein
MIGTTLVTSANFLKTVISILPPHMASYDSATLTYHLPRLMNGTHGLQRMSSRVDEEQATVDPGIRDEPITLSRELFSEVSRILVFDLSSIPTRSAWLHARMRAVSRGTYVSDDRLPTAFIVDLIAITGGINNVQLEPDSSLDDDYGAQRCPHQDISTFRCCPRPQRQEWRGTYRAAPP